MRVRSHAVVFGLGLVLTLSTGVDVEAKPAYFRFPDIHDEHIVFCAESDIWITSERGGMSRRLTTHAGTEYFPQFSPDGRWIAFTGQYDGNRDVFVLSRDGGEPRRLTWHPGQDAVIGWSRDGRHVLFRSSREAPHGSPEIYRIPAEGGDPEKLPLGWAARLDEDPRSGRWAFNRKSWENATWKRYRGGTAPDIWVGDPRRSDFRPVTDSDAVDAFPMWHEGRIFFFSDKGGTQNIWSVSPDGSDRTRHTDFDEWDARWPSMGPDGKIVFTLAADVHVFDPQSGRTSKIDVDLPSDRTLTRVRYPSPAGTVTWLDLTPEADRIVLTTRGEIFSVPVKEGVTLPVTRGSGARESWASFDPEGRRVIYVTDESGEEELRSIDAWGRGEPEVLKPAGKNGWHFPPIFSPDGEWIAFADQTHTLYVMPAEGGKPKKVDQSPQSEINSYVWSPDGRWLAYSKAHRTDYESIYLYDTKEHAVHPVTGASTNDRSPAWDPKGRYLYFLSDRATNPVLGSRDWQNIEARATRPYMVLLRDDVKNPFARLAGLPPDDEDEEDDDSESEDADEDEQDKDQKGKDEKDDEKDEKDEKEDEPKPIEIDLEGLSDRVVVLPVERGRYFALGAKADKVFYLEAPIRGMAEMPGLFQSGEPQNKLISFALEKKKAETFAEGVAGYGLAAKADKMVLLKGGGQIFVVETGAPPGAALGESAVSLAGVVVELDPREEWEQIYYEGWRHMRDFYWDSGMSGVNWEAERDRYSTLLPRLATRSELQDLMGELIGELATSHTYVFGGDQGVAVPSVSTGLLGVDLEREGEAYRVERILRADPADNVRSPLDEPGAGVKEGDYVLAVNHRPFAEDRSVYASFAQLAGKEVVLTVNDKPSRDGARDIVVRTLGNEGELRYSDWVRRNREYVAEKTEGKIGYLHLPDMWTNGLVEFNTWFYPQLDREGLIVDVRWNGGGAVSQMIVERLRRPVVSFDRSRGGGITTYPTRVLNGPFVVLTNEFAGSDGDIFPMAVQLEGLAPVIGMRSWGGVVGIRGDKPLVDGGLLTQPEFAWWDPQQGWELENRGVVPDIEVQNLPQELARSVDTQLDRAVEEVLRLHRQHPPIRPDFGPARDKSRKAYRKELAD